MVKGRGGWRGPEEKGRYNMMGGCHILWLCPRSQDPVGGKKGMDIFEAVSQKWSAIHEGAQSLRWRLRLADPCSPIEFGSTDSPVRVLWPRCSSTVKRLQRPPDWDAQTPKSRYWLLFRTNLCYNMIKHVNLTSMMSQVWLIYETLFV